MGRVLANRMLIPHPEGIAPAIAIAVTIGLAGEGRVTLSYRVTGAVAGLSLPPPGPVEWADGLWEHSCFEAFVRPPSGGYVEYNVAPSRRWASYRFDAYREGMRPAAESAPPDIQVETGAGGFVLDVMLDLSSLIAAGGLLGLSAVIEERGGGKSYWALAHPPGKPDFHDARCFVFELPAAG